MYSLYRYVMYCDGILEMLLQNKQFTYYKPLIGSDRPICYQLALFLIPWVTFKVIQLLQDFHMPFTYSCVAVYNISTDIVRRAISLQQLSFL